MDLATDDDFLAVVAQQARVAYASQQLHALRNLLQDLQTHSAPDASANLHSARTAYYIQQLERWQTYLESLVGFGAAY